MQSNAAFLAGACYGAGIVGLLEGSLRIVRGEQQLWAFPIAGFIALLLGWVLEGLEKSLRKGPE